MDFGFWILGLSTPFGSCIRYFLITPTRVGGFSLIFLGWLGRGEMFLAYHVLTIQPCGQCSWKVPVDLKAAKLCQLPFEELLRVWHPDKNPESCEVAGDLRMLVGFA